MFELSKIEKKGKLEAAVYIAERVVLQGNFSEPKNPRFIIESGFKSRAGNNGARTVYDHKKYALLIKHNELFE